MFSIITSLFFYLEKKVSWHNNLIEKNFFTFQGGRFPIIKEEIYDSDSSDDEGWLKTPLPPKEVLSKKLLTCVGS